VPSDLYGVYEGRRSRDPALAVRVVSADGRAFHVIREDGLRYREDVPTLPLLDAITEAFRRADWPLPRAEVTHD
jgi:hypothetical protein